MTKYGQFVSEAKPDPCHKSHQGYAYIIACCYCYTNTIRIQGTREGHCLPY